MAVVYALDRVRPQRSPAKLPCYEFFLLRIANRKIQRLQASRAIDKFAALINHLDQGRAGLKFGVRPNLITQSGGVRCGDKCLHCPGFVGKLLVNRDVDAVSHHPDRGHGEEHQRGR